MRKLFPWILAAAAIAPAIPVSAAQTDAEGYPVFYLRGSDYDNWAAQPANQMQRDGNVYSLTVQELKGEFKLSNDDWTLNYGASGQSEITGSMTVDGRQEGANYKAPNTLQNVTISFVYDRNNSSETQVTFSMGGDIPPVPTPNPDPDPTPNPDPTPDDPITYPVMYLRGDQMGNWSATEQLRMQREGNVYTLTVQELKGEFKLSNDDWSINYGADGVAEITGAMTVGGQLGGPNYKASNPLQNVTISFTYDPNNSSYTQVTFSMGGIVPTTPDPDPTPDPTPVDPGNYPVMYLKGDQMGNWSNTDELRMQREGNVYSLTVQELKGEFKLSDDNWTINYGAAGQAEITGAVTVDGVLNGPNFKAPNTLRDVTISFTYDPNNSSKTQVTFAVGGVVPPVPTPSNGTSGTLPVLYINVTDENGNLNNEIIDYNLSHKNYFSGTYWLDLNGCEWMEAEGAASIGSAEEPLPLEIKARGNWTRTGFSKKPFKLKLGKKQSLLGLSKSKHFAILAHADDNYGYLRNFTGFNLGRRIGLPWTPSQQPVEVIINGDYRGLYFLTESIRVEEDRVNITELNDGETDLSLISGGYLVELDNYDEDYECQIRMQEKGDYPGFKDMLRITFDTPEVYSEEQRMFINDQFVMMNNLVGQSSERLWSYVDLDDLARYYLVCEIVSHVEAFHGSTYMFRDYGAGQKWHFSPLWDFGNAFNGPTDGYIYDNAQWGMTWIGSITWIPGFKEKVVDTWKWFLSNGFNGIYDDMATVSGHLTEAAKADLKRWKDQPTPYNGMPVTDNTDMQWRLNDARSHMERKIEWLKQRFGEYSDAVYPEPARDTTPAAPLPEYIMTGVQPVVAIPEDAEAIYNLQGVRVSEPTPGNVYIIVNGEGSRKVLLH